MVQREEVPHKAEIVAAGSRIENLNPENTLTQNRLITFEN